MMNVNTNTSTGQGSMMPRYFSPWNDYKTFVLFKSWDVTEPWQFALTWFAVCFAVVFYHFLDCIILCLKKAVMISSHENDCNHSSRGWQVIKMIYSAIEAIKFSFGLILMLVAMTYSAALFLALFIGYFLGDFAFCDLHMSLTTAIDEKTRHWTDIYTDALVNRLLCVETTK